MKIIFTIIIGFFTVFTGKTQVLENRLNVYIGYNAGNFTGNLFSNDNGFIYPLLYSNMDGLTGYSAKTTWKISPALGVGIEGSQMLSSGWALEGYDNYQGAEISLFYISPVLQIHRRFKTTGIFNRVKLFCEIAPVLGKSIVNLQNPIFEIQPQDNTNDEFTESIDSYVGAKGSAGFEFLFSNHSGMYLRYSLQQNAVSSALFADDKFTVSHLNIGIFVRLIKYKRYNY